VGPALARHPVFSLGAWRPGQWQRSASAFVVYGHSFTPWEPVGAHVVAYAVLVAPALLLRSPPTGARAELPMAAERGPPRGCLVAGAAVAVSAHALANDTRHL